MQIEKASKIVAKGWYLGRWNSNLNISIGYANAGIDEPHLHKRTTEVYLIGCGTAEMRIKTRTVLLNENDVIVIEPGQAHTFLTNSEDYFHFVIHTPGLEGEEGRMDKISISRSRLGLG